MQYIRKKNIVLTHTAPHTYASDEDETYQPSDDSEESTDSDDVDSTQ